MLVGMVGIKDHHHPFRAGNIPSYAVDQFRVDGGAFEHRDTLGQGVGFDRLPIVIADIDVDADDPAFANKL